MFSDRTEIDTLADEEFAKLEQRVEKLLSVWEIKNLRGQAATFHDDQHIGEKRRELHALKHPSFDVEGEMAFRAKAVVDSLAGNSLIHPLTTPIIEVNDECTRQGQYGGPLEWKDCLNSARSRWRLSALEWCRGHT